MCPIVKYRGSKNSRRAFHHIGMHVTGLLSKARWALYEKKKLDAIINDITDFIDKLVKFFLDAKKSQTALYEKELLTIGDTINLTRLKDIIGADDQVL